MNPTLPTKHQLIQALLSYANNIVPVDKQEILDFFISNNLPYHDEHIDFLAQFGGARTEFFDAINLNCTFQEIKEIYIEDHPDNAILPNFSYNTNTGIQVIYDREGDYFRIFNPRLNGKRKYLDLDGNIPNNKTLPNGKQVGRSQDEYNSETHFKVDRDSKYE